ncbi:MAG: MotE family protein [Magnetovibrionaceae bacterium]
MMEFLGKIRFLPVTIFAASLMLTFKIGSIWQDMDGMDREPAISVAEVQAQEATPAAEPTPADAPAGGQADAATDPGAQDAGIDEAAPERDPNITALDDPTLLTQAEIDLLQQLAERREELDQRERELSMRTELLRAAEARIDDKVSELRLLEQTIQELVQTYDDQQQQRLDSLVKIYENMKPKDAAKIFQELEMVTLLDVVERMKERKLAPIMANMDPVRATEITVELRRLREIPAAGTEDPLGRGG